MILTDLKHIARYKGIHKNIDKAIDHMLSTNLCKLEVGRYELDEENFFFVQEFETMYENRFEAHGKRTDIQLLLKGTEGYRVRSLKELDVLEEFSEEKDIGFFGEKEALSTRIDLRAGQMLILFPEDAHMPALAAPYNEPTVEKCKKIVYKLVC